MRLTMLGRESLRCACACHASRIQGDRPEKRRLLPGEEILDRVPERSRRRFHPGQGSGRRTRSQGEKDCRFSVLWLDSLSSGGEIKAPLPGAEKAEGSLVRSWSTRADRVNNKQAFRTCFALKPPEPGDDSNGGRWNLEYYLQASDDPSLLIPARDHMERVKKDAQLLEPQIRQPSGEAPGGPGKSGADVPGDGAQPGHFPADLRSIKHTGSERFSHRSGPAAAGQRLRRHPPRLVARPLRQVKVRCEAALQALGR